MDQSELEVNTCNRRQARENASERGTVGFGSHWLKKWREFVNQSQSAGKQNQSNYQITFDTQLKTAICFCLTLNSTFYKSLFAVTMTGIVEFD